MTAGKRAWRAEGVALRYRGAGRDAVLDVDLEITHGEVVALVGPNGSGKSTLLRLLLGSLTPDRGRVAFDGRPLAGWGGRELARRVAALPQHEEPAFPVTVRELAAMGRYPHLGSWRALGAVDRAAIDDALVRCDVARLADRRFDTLSGGERQRSRLARALAGRPDALALDEPTAALDVAAEMRLWRMLREEADGGRAVVLATHDLNLAARFADRLVLLEAGRVAATGSPVAVLTEPILRRVYGWPLRIVPHPGPGPDRGAPQIVPLEAGA